jgi:hypothetical protein
LSLLEVLSGFVHQPLGRLTAQALGVVPNPLVDLLQIADVLLGLLDVPLEGLF